MRPRPYYIMVIAWHGPTTSSVIIGPQLIYPVCITRYQYGAFAITVLVILYGSTDWYRLRTGFSGDKSIRTGSSPYRAGCSVKLSCAHYYAVITWLPALYSYWQNQDTYSTSSVTERSGDMGFCYRTCRPQWNMHVIIYLLSLCFIVSTLTASMQMEKNAKCKQWQAFICTLYTIKMQYGWLKYWYIDHVD